MLYSAYEPWGAKRDNIHAGQICAQIFNSNRSKKQRAASYQDYMLVNREAHQQSMRGKVVNFFRALGKKRNG